jgi:hypothetical protein
VDKIPEGFAYSAGYFLQHQDAGSSNAASFDKEALQAGFPFIPIGGRLCDTQPGTQPTP